ncbi:MAG TPA: hypothetical protein ENK25_09805 [Bacteroidetes bacterium]|nr:hypothetical protein [Bacteroidota bacterium]
MSDYKTYRFDTADTTGNRRKSQRIRGDCNLYCRTHPGKSFRKWEDRSAKGVQIPYEIYMVEGKKEYPGKTVSF